MWNLDALAQLGEIIRREGIPPQVIDRAIDDNPWFTEKGIVRAVNTAATTLLDGGSLQRWMSRYDRPDNLRPKNTGIVMAGNIPLVGLSDLVAVIACGHRAFLKMSSKDTALMQWIVDQLKALDPCVPVHRLEEDTTLEAVIATGSNNANRYFQSRFAGVPRILRHNRTSIAVLSGRESQEQLLALWEDVFTYFGLGCRNVTRILVPEGYDFSHLVDVFSRKAEETRHKRFRDCYRYNRALHLLNEVPFIDGGYFTLRRSGEAVSPLAEINYDYYTTPEAVAGWIEDNKSFLQCVVSDHFPYPGTIRLGQAQCPSLTDYPDGVDLVEFLLSV